MSNRGRKPLPGRILKASTLVKLGACKHQVRLFRKTFGSQVRITAKLAARHASKFELWFPANTLLPEKQRNHWYGADVAFAIYGSNLSDKAYQKHRAVRDRIAGAWFGYLYERYGLDEDQALKQKREAEKPSRVAIS